MIGKILNWGVQRKLGYMIRAEQQRGGDTWATLCQVHESFGEGAAASLRKERPEKAREQALQLSWNRRPFFWEGYGFGLAGIQALSPTRHNPETGRITPHYNGMHFTGYGFWNGLARSYRLPRISLDLARSGLNEGYFEKYAPTMIGGEAFALVNTSRRLDDRLLERLRLADQRSAVQAAYHGCGRALWFLNMDEPRRLEMLVARYPDQASELIEGLGFAIAFTFVEHPNRILDLWEVFRGDYRSGLMRGAGIALQSFVHEDPAAEAHVALIPQADLRSAWEICRQVERETEDGPDWYARGLDLIRRRLP